MNQRKLEQEVVWLREQIRREHNAASYALSDSKLSAAARKWFVQRRMERINSYQARLSMLIGQQASFQYVLDVINDASRRSAQAA